MRYTRAHGTGNDFVVLADLEDDLELSADLARALADRRTGVGGDGVIRIGPPPPDVRADAFMDHRNADGSVAEMCGNGVRVVAKHLVDHGLVDAADGVVRVATRAGVKPIRVLSATAAGVESVAVDMGPPSFDPTTVPFETDDADAVTHQLDVGAAPATRVQLSVVSMGNPHAVVRCEDVDAAPVEDLGPAIEGHPRFPAKVNVGFAQVLDRHSIKLRVWERGVGETMACGTGACAAVCALQRQGLLDGEVEVHLPGGVLTITHRPGGTVTMAGPAVEIAHGVVDDAWLTAARRGITGG